MAAATGPHPVELLLVEDDPGGARLTGEALRAGRLRDRVKVMTDAREALRRPQARGSPKTASDPGRALARPTRRKPRTPATPEDAEGGEGQAQPARVAPGGVQRRERLSGGDVVVTLSVAVTIGLAIPQPVLDQVAETLPRRQACA